MPEKTFSPCPLPSLSFVLSTEEQTANLATKLASSITHLATTQPNLRLHISLVGDLGAGKTTFTRYLLKALGHTGKVKSPTYALCEPYDLLINGHQLAIHHFDLYRMKYAEEWVDAGFRDTFSNPGICLVEWGEKAEGTLPKVDCTVTLEMNEDESRQMVMTSHSDLGEALLRPIH
jgi:tRNA threonylcarbamoyladenosine biosynthesis protein TsaE